MPNGDEENGTPWWINITKAFAGLVPLASMGIGATFDMVYNKKSLDQVANQEADNRDREAYVDEGFGFMDGGDGGYEEYEGMHPDIVDQAMYQLENPNALMTPWGPGLADEVIDMVLAENPAMEGLLGLGDKERAAIQGEADSLLDKAGDFIAGLWNQGSEIAMSVGEDPLNVTKGLFDTISTNIVAEVATSLAGQVVQGAQQTTTEQYYEDLLLMPPGQAMQTGVGAGAATGDDGDDEEDKGWWERLVEGFAPPGAQHGAALAQEQQRIPQIISKMLDDALVPDPSEGYKATDDEIIPDFFRMMIGGDISTADVDSFLDRNSELETERLSLWNGLMGAMEIVGLHNKVNQPGGAPYSLELIDYTPEKLAIWAYQLDDLVPPVNYLYPVSKPSDVDEGDLGGGGGGRRRWLDPQKPQKDVAEAGYVAAKDGDLTKAANLAKVWYEVMATVPQGNHPEVRRRAVELQGEAELVFWLWWGGSAHTALAQADIAGQGDFADVEDMYRGFLSRDAPVYASWLDDDEGIESLPSAGKIGYVHNPDMYRSGGQFLQKVDELKDILARWRRDGFEMDNWEEASPMLALFGEDDTFSYERLHALAMLYVTGGHKGYMAQRIQNTITRGMNYQLTMGKTPTEVFMETTSSPVVGQPFSRPPSPLPQYDFSDIEAIRADPAYYETVSGIPRTPSPQPQYDFRDIEGDPFRQGAGLSGTTTDWGSNVEPILIPGSSVVDPTMLFPSFNPAYLSVSDPDPADVAAYEAAREVSQPWAPMPVSEKMYKEAMEELKAVEPGTTYKPYESEVAVTGIAEDTLKSMPTPFNEEQAKRLSKGLPYKTGRSTGHTAYEWSTLSSVDKQTIMAGDLWVAGTTFVPTKAWGA
jgi:hypothetical protein